MSSLPPLSIVMPCLNEEDNLAAAVQDALKALYDKGVEGEVIVVNDGSTDKSQVIVEEIALSDPRVQVLNRKKKGGHRTGILGWRSNCCLSFCGNDSRR